jgi:hypothetical protein
MMSPSLSADTPIGFGLAIHRIDALDRDQLLAERRAGTARIRTRGGRIHHNLGHQLGVRIDQNDPVRQLDEKRPSGSVLPTCGCAPEGACCDGEEASPWLTIRSCAGVRSACVVPGDLWRRRKGLRPQKFLAPVRIVFKDSRAQLDLLAALGDALAHFEGHEPRQLVDTFAARETADAADASQTAAVQGHRHR